MSTTRNYSSIYNIKDFARNHLMPKYFDVKEVNDFNVGLLGMTTELISSGFEDTFNTVSMYIKELFPNTATMSETIYTYASLFQISELFANPASMDIILMVKESDILNLGTINGGAREFIVDCDTIIDIQGIQYMLDYDVIIRAKKYLDDYIFTSIYDYRYKNSLNPSTASPYIKNIRYNGEEGKYLGLMVRVHQVSKFKQEEVITNNTRINYPKFKIKYDDMIANFEVFYKSPSMTTETQLTKRLKNSVPIEQPFCYDRFKDNNEIEISFSTREKSFQPEFNSDIRIEYYTTQGTKGNYPLYKGSILDIVVSPQSDKYEYLSSVTMFAIPQTDSLGGTDTLAFDDLKKIVNEKFSTVNTITTENDLLQYFDNAKYRMGSHMLFVKKRDDVFERLFTAFTLLKDRNNELIHTNTLNLELNLEDVGGQTGDRTAVIKPGTIMKYRQGSIDTVEISEVMGRNEEDFRFMNPFLINIITEPSTSVGFYLNSVNEKFPLNYFYINDECPAQFICNNVEVTRDALHGDDFYELTIDLMNTSGMEPFPFFEENGEWTDNLKVKCMFKDEETSKDLCYIDFKFSTYDAETGIMTFKAKLNTDDVLTLNNRIRVTDVKDLQNGNTTTKMIGFSDIIIDICAFYKSDIIETHKYSNLEDLNQYKISNIYSSIDNPVSLVYSFDIIRSQLSYLENSDKQIKLRFLPLFSAYDMQDKNKFDDTVDRLRNQYNFLTSVLQLLENNYSIDMKFYNTYGHAKVFTIDDGSLLDRVNCTIRFDLFLVPGADEAQVLNNVKVYISEYFEKLNLSVDNSVKISNLIQEIENTFPDVDYLKFVSINEYDSNIQVLKNVLPANTTTMDKEQLKEYVPEYVTARDSRIDLRLLDS